MKNCKQIATEWGLSERTVNDLCKKNKIDGAIKVGKMWKIPDDAKKPIDGRITSGKYVRHSAGVTRKPLPIGISDYVRAQADYYYVDKTMLIKEFLDQKPLVSLFTRPRRFGKTLNMDMLRVFFEISEENTSKYFEDKAIWQCGEEYRNQQGQYPVVFLTFKDVKFDSWKATLDKSNRESGDGRYDIGLFPREDRYPGILMELKWKKNLSADELSELADEALAQIGKKRYDVEMKENGTQDILKFGIVFSGKKVSVKIE